MSFAGFECVPGYYMPECESPRDWADEPFWETVGGSIFDVFVPDPIEWLWDIVTDPLPVYVPPVIEEIPEGWETVVIGGVERVRVPEEIGGGPEPVLEEFDPDVVIGEVQGVDTAQQNDVSTPVGEEWNVAHDWGHWIRESLTGIAGEVFGGGDGIQPASLVANGAMVQGVAAGAPPGTAGGDCDGMAWGGGTPPKGYKVVNSCGKGVLRRVRRRRRRRMLTSGDKDDIASIVSMVGKGQMASALINGSMRRG